MKALFKHWRSAGLVIVSVLYLSSNQAVATDVSGTINSNTTWTDVGTRQSTDESLEIISFKDETYAFQADRIYRIVIFKP
jgi:hypothetical protein|tara:strand:- start:297 stop:536 length:240 start_codon:yes stop_codon:yes gene_type:complete